MKKSSSRKVASSAARPAKRPKTNLACDTCRKAKTRCEVIGFIEEDSPVQCHRCKTLSVSCSFQTMDRSHFTQPPRQEEDLNCPEFEPTTSGSSPGSSSESAVDMPRKSLKPGHPEALYAFMLNKDNLDFEKAPLDAIRQLIKQPPKDPTQFSLVGSGGVDLLSILSEQHIQHLMEQFDAFYTPWLQFCLSRSQTYSILELSCCLITSRHLDPIPRSILAPQLQKLTEDTVLQMLLNSQAYESMQSIQALLILSMWLPVCGLTDSTIWHGSLLIASAVKMAMSMKLNEASKVILKVPANSPRFQELYDKARVWSALVNTEAILNLGTTLTPTSGRSSFDFDFIPITPASPTGVRECRDLRIRLSAELLLATENMFTLTLPSPELHDLNKWYDAVVAGFHEFDRLGRMLSHLESISSHDNFHFHMLVLLQLSCRLSALDHVTSTARHVCNAPGTTDTWTTPIKPYGGPNVLLSLGKDTLATAESILLTFIKSDLGYLPTSPDCIWVMICYAAIWLVGANFMFLERFGREMVGWGIQLVKKSKELMESAVGSYGWEGDHPAKRCGLLLGCLIESWERRVPFDCAKVKVEMANMLTNPALGGANKMLSLPSNFSLPSPPNTTFSSPPDIPSNTFDYSTNFSIPPPTSLPETLLDMDYLSGGKDYDEMWNIFFGVAGLGDAIPQTLDPDQEQALNEPYQSGFQPHQAHHDPNIDVNMQIPMWSQDVGQSGYNHQPQSDPLGSVRGDAALRMTALGL